MARRLLRKVEAGESAGIVVNEASRFARSLAQVADACERLERSRGRLVGVLDGTDTGERGGEFILNVRAAVAREQWRTFRSGFGDAISRAVKDGVHVGKTPPGYRRENGTRSKLIPDPETAPAVREVFERRANGTSWRELADFLREHRVQISPSGVQGMVQSRTYLGEVRAAQGAVNLEAHEPLVTEQVWEAAQQKRRPGRAPKHNGRFSANALLASAGVLKCAGCGGMLHVTGASAHDKAGTRRAVYYCRKHRLEKCPAPASAVAAPVDQYLRDALVVALHDGTLTATMDAVERYARAEQDVAQAKRRLAEVSETRVLEVFGQERWLAMGAEAREALDEAKRVLRDTPKPGDAIVPTAGFWDDEYLSDGSVVARWDMEKQRRFVRQFVKEIRLKRSGRGRWSPPIGERLEVTWAGHAELDTTLPARVEKLREEMQPLDRVLASAS